MTLNELRTGQAARVERISLPGAERLRLIELGVTPGVTIALLRRAPLGDPVEALLRGYRLMLRRREAEGIILAQAGGREAGD